jgi:Signal transduction histidine kinase
MPNVEKRKITRKVTGGFFILLLLVAAAIYLLVYQANRAKPYREATELAGKKAAVVNSMLSRLLEVERLGRAFLSTTNERYLKAYRYNFRQLRSDLEILKEENSENKNQLARIYRVDSFINQKQHIFESMFALKKQYVVDTLNRDSILYFAQSISDSVRVTKTILERHTIERIPYKVEPEKKTGFLKRIWNSITGDKDEEEQSIKPPPPIETRMDTSIKSVSHPDTTILSIKNQLIGIRHKELSINQEISLQEKLLQANDQKIANDVRKLLYLIEQEELRMSAERAQQSAIFQQKLYWYSLGLGIIGLLTIIIFSLLIMRDLTRSEFYRQELEEAKALAEEHLKIKEQFMATMSHEIRTPITSIIGFTEQLGQTKLSSQQQTYQSIISKSSEHLLGLINDILDFSKIEAGMIKLEHIPFSPYETLKEAIEIIAPKVRDKKLKLTSKIDFQSSLTLIGDPLRLRQLALNLLGNAVKFTEQGEVKLKASTEKVEGKNILLHIFIEDTGIGIPKELQGDIFKEFTQSESGITRKYGGTGLGLAISKRLVELQHGSIGVTSIPAKGSEFYAKIPFELSAVDLPPQTETVNSLSPDCLSSFRILIAEDDSTTQLLTKNILEKHGATIDIAGNGIEALTYLKQTCNTYHLLISDVHMPKMGGPELIQHMQKISNFNRIPTLCVTANNAESEKQTFMDAGFNSVLVKPFYEHQLLEKVGILLKLPFEIIASSKQSSSFPKLTFENIKQFTGDDQEAYTAILHSLDENIQITSQNLKEALDKKNHEEIANLAHRILPHLRQLNALEAAHILAALEQLRNEHEINFVEVQKQLTSLYTKFEEVINGIKEELDKL